MNDIVAFLRARLAEDEQVARAATPGGWFWDAEADCFSTSARTESLGDHSWPATVVGATGEHTNGFVLVETTDAAHITRFDPARVLAEVEAKRRIIELHREARYTNIGLDIRDASVCCSCHVVIDEPDDWPEDQEWSWPLVQEQFPCKTLRALALPYHDQPDYVSEWAP